MNQVSVLWEYQGSPDWSERVEPFVRWILSYLQISCWEINILFASKKTIRRYNNQFLCRDYATDILSFSHDQTPPTCYSAGGDLLVCPDVIAEHAQQFSVSFEEELNRTLIHGVLHLAEWDHEEDHPAGPMMELQEKILTDAFTQEEHIYVAVA